MRYFKDLKVIKPNTLAINLTNDFVLSLHEAKT